MGSGGAGGSLVVVVLLVLAVVVPPVDAFGDSSVSEHPRPPSDDATRETPSTQRIEEVRTTPCTPIRQT
jgi:hypothetical protein